MTMGPAQTADIPGRFLPFILFSVRIVRLDFFRWHSPIGVLPLEVVLRSYPVGVFFLDTFLWTSPIGILSLVLFSFGILLFGFLSLELSH